MCTYRGPENVVVVGGSSNIVEVCRIRYQISVEQSIKNLQQSAQTCHHRDHYTNVIGYASFGHRLNLSVIAQTTTQLAIIQYSLTAIIIIVYIPWRHRKTVWLWCAAQPYWSVKKCKRLGSHQPFQIGTQGQRTHSSSVGEEEMHILNWEKCTRNSLTVLGTTEENGLRAEPKMVWHAVYL